MKKSFPRQSFTVAAAGVLLSGLVFTGAAHAALVGAYGSGGAGTLTNVSGTASVTSQFGTSSQSIAGSNPAVATVNASGTAAVPVKYSNATQDIPWTMQLQSSIDPVGHIVLSMNSTGSNNSASVMPFGSFVAEASWHATLVNTTGSTASFGVDLYSYANDALYYGSDPLSQTGKSLSAVVTASFGGQQYDVSGYSYTYAIDGVVLKPGESAPITLNYKITSTYPYALNNLSLQGDFVESVSTPVVAAVPEPATNALMAMGLMAVVCVAKRRKG